MHSPFKGILFDLDGTLLNTADDLGAALNHVLANRGFPLIEKKAYTPIASDGSTGLLNLGFGEKLEEFNIEELRKEFLSYYDDNIATYTHLYAGIKEFITYLNSHNIPWGIVTNKPIGLTNKLLPHFHELNDSIINLGGDSLSVRKPNPLPLLHACEQLKIQPSECVYLGDAPRDIEAGNAAGMYSIIALWGYIPNKADLKSWSANDEYQSPNELLKLFETNLK